MRHGSALAAACAAVLAGTASAQECKGPNCPGQKIYPKLESKYIKQFCGPTIIPGSCHGHFQTQWRKWEDACPNGNCDPAAAANSVIVSTTETPVDSNALPTPKEAPKVEAPKVEVPKLEAPKVEVPKLETPKAPKLETAPKPGKKADTGKGPTAQAPQELLIPVIPSISPVGAPAIVMPSLSK
jgi:hypothetical protein